METMEKDAELVSRHWSEKLATLELIEASVEGTTGRLQESYRKLKRRYLARHFGVLVETYTVKA